jgi:hypothetical protein
MVEPEAPDGYRTIKGPKGKSRRGSKGERYRLGVLSL